MDEDDVSVGWGMCGWWMVVMKVIVLVCCVFVVGVMIGDVRRGLRDV